MTVTVNGRPVSFEVDPFVLGGRTMAQVRPLAEAMGAEIDWNDVSQTVTLTRGWRNARCQVGSEVGLINGNGQFLDEPPVFVGDAVIVPVRFAAEGMGFQAQWDEGRRTVSLVG
ncbi:MAG TPA: copper amine oxidase N-terminal domain-containing protein [Symbiobacteriaceae bacterium]|nr:copper amine oxidase N-terminal domain-containing protein [Symbiobacteriaceae bacterium]